MASAEAGWPAPNHKYGPARQLRDGVRGLMLDLHYWGGEVALCHSQCGMGNIPLGEFLAELRRFMHDNPREVVTLILESYVQAVDVARALAAARLDTLVHTQPAGVAWPTLGSMIDSGGRLVILADREGGKYPWYHDVWKHAWETDWSNKTEADFDCERSRGEAANPLFILNHFLGNPLPSPELAAAVNRRDLLLTRARRCATERGRTPNFITVDFHDEGDLMAVVAELNGL